MLRVFDDVVVEVSRVKQLAQGQGQQLRQIVAGHGVHQHLDRVDRLTRRASAIERQRLRERRSRGPQRPSAVNLIGRLIEQTHRQQERQAVGIVHQRKAREWLRRQLQNRAIGWKLTIDVGQALQLDVVIGR